MMENINFENKNMTTNTGRDELYHLFSTYLSGLPRSVVLSLGEVS